MRPVAQKALREVGSAFGVEMEPALRETKLLPDFYGTSQSALSRWRLIWTPKGNPAPRSLILQYMSVAAIHGSGTNVVIECGTFFIHLNLAGRQRAVGHLREAEKPAHQQDHAVEEQKPVQSLESLLQALQSETVDFIEARPEDVEVDVKRMDAEGTLSPFPRPEVPQPDDDDDDVGGPE